MKDTIESKNIISNLIWRFLERCGAQGVAFIVSIVLARLLVPEVYGTIALVTVVTNILNVFVDSGLGNALIQKKDADDVDFSTVFYFNMFVCICLYIGVFFTAPLVAKFYNDCSLVPVIRVLSLTLVISGVKNVQQAYVSRTMQFKRFFFATLGGTIGAAIIGIAMAYRGYGVWALVAQQIFNSLVDTAILWFTVRWRPKCFFSFERLKNLFSYGWKLLASALLETLYSNMRQLIIGKVYSSADLAFYNRGNNFPSLIVTNVNTSIDSVLLPVLSREQDDCQSIKTMTRRAIKTSTFIMAPLMMGLMACATPFVRLLLTEKWVACVPYLRIFCITYLFYPIHTANLNAIKAVGRSDVFLKMEFMKKAIGVILLLLTVKHGVMAMAYSLLVSCVTSMIINSWPNKKLLNYGYREQMVDIMPELILAFGMGFCVSMLQLLHFSDIETLVLQIFIGAIIYIGAAAIFKIDSFMYLIKVAKQYIKRE